METRAFEACCARWACLNDRRTWAPKREGSKMTPTLRAKVPLPVLEIIPAERRQESILANLLELYIHDFSEFHNCELGEDGRFGYAKLPLYWNEPGKHAFLVRMDGKLAGFVLVGTGSTVSRGQQVWDMAEFFVLRAYRKRGVGTNVAHMVWKRFPGSWEVRVMPANVPAQRFWASAIMKFTGEAPRPQQIEQDGGAWQVFSFTSKP